VLKPFGCNLYGHWTLQANFLATHAPIPYVPLFVVVSAISTFRTSDWDMPNCRAICDGLMPALNAARTALICVRFNGTVANSACRLSFDDDRSRSSDGFCWRLGGKLPRRFASSTAAVISRSNSVSVRCLTALGRSLGRTCRCETLSAPAFVTGASGAGEPRTISVENRSGVAG